MRILGVRFKNLNSLIGEWAIDLTHPAFSSDGIFAITGPTGAGKTTILDAICLALYGRTPRLIRVNKSGNEIMSRQTGDCFAEITFETQGGNYRCHWSQHRGRKKANGELQLPRHELSHANSGEIIASSIRGVAQRVEAITGMDFDRFTRSMLLAQGGFAAFLQAAPDERAPILEQITGTEIYSHISVRVHERRIHENKTLKELQSELAGMQLLEPDAEQQLGASLEEKTTRDKVVSQRITDNSLAIRWIEDIARLEEALKQLDGQKASLQIRLEAFEPENQRLRLANQALELSGDYSTLTAIRDSQKKDLEIIGEFRESLPDREQAVAQATGVKRVATDQREVKRLEQEKAKPVIRKVQALDLKMVEKEIPIRTISQTIEENSASLKSQHKHLTDTRTELIGERTALEKLLLQLEAT
ncbi:MAG: AAA family ATPase, partial [Gammaproteobacteria bacterium]|nr:AAA family ATPase [Gammaproteobacteria bacterium]